MIHLFLSSVAMCMAIVCFDYAYRLPNIETAYLGLYKGLVEKAVVVVDAHGDYLERPYFHLSLLNKAVGEHLRTNLLQYCPEYRYEVVRHPDDNAYAPDGYANIVRIAFECDLNPIKHIRKSASFTLWRTDYEQ